MSLPVQELEAEIEGCFIVKPSFKTSKSKLFFREQMALWDPLLMFCMLKSACIQEEAGEVPGKGTYRMLLHAHCKPCLAQEALS